MKDNSVVIAGYYGFGNAGDELILRSLLQQLRTKDPEIQIVVLSANPQQTREHFGVEAIDRWRPWAWIGPLARAKRFILGGGGLLQESSSARNHAYYLSLLMLAKCLGCETEIRAVGVDPITHSLNRWWTRFVMNYWVNILSVRDTDSLRALDVAGVDRRLLRTPDLVFQLVLPASQVNPSKKQKIAFALAPWKERPTWSKDIVSFLDRTIDRLSVDVDLLIFYPAQDEPLSRDIAAGMRHPIQVRVWSTPEDLLAWITEYDLVVGMRYHALALAALAQKPFIGWGFQRKVNSLCRDFSQPIWAFERGWDEDVVFRQLSETWRHRDILPHRYLPRLHQLKSASTEPVSVTHITTAHA